MVVLRELPRTRDTLLLRLLGRGRTLRLALEDLANLPPDSPEAAAAGESILAARRLVEETPDPDPEAKAFLMATHESFEVWKANIEARGVAKGATNSVLFAYAQRFGPLPRDMEEALHRLVTADNWAPWLGLMISAPSAEAVAAAIRRGEPTV